MEYTEWERIKQERDDVVREMREIYEHHDEVIQPQQKEAIGDKPK
jgi:hypothetical protein